jgi:hypothetical protein
MSVPILCAGCHRSLSVPETELGQMVQCPLCIETFVAERDPNPPSQPKPSPAPSRPSRPADRVEMEPAADGSVATAIREDEEPLVATPVAAPVRERPTKPFRPVLFAVQFARDPDRLLRGQADSEIALEGLRIRLRGRRDLYASVCGPHPARYLGGNRLAVFLDGREVVLNVIRGNTDLTKLARDMAAFLNGEKAALDNRDYRLPWRLRLSPWLALGVPFLAIWLRVLGGVHNGARFLWFLLAVMFVYLAYRIPLRRQALSTRRRVVWLGVVLGSFLLLLGGAWSYRAANPLTVRNALWQTRDLAAARCRIEMPTDRPDAPLARSASSNFNGGTVTMERFQTYVTEQRKSFHVLCGRADNQQLQQWGGTREYLQQRRRDFERNEVGYDNSYNTRVDFVTVKGARDSLGLQFSFVRRDYNRGRGDEETYVARVFVMNGRVYILAVSGEDVYSGDPDVARFFESFQAQSPQVAVSPRMFTPVVHWSFDNLQEGDQFGQRYMNLLPAEGVLEGAGRFDLNQWDTHVNFSNRPNLNLGENQPFSIVGWFRTSNESGCLVSIKAWSQNPRKNPGLDIVLFQGCVTASFRATENNAPLILKYGQYVADDAWHHYALTRDANGEFRLYVDGQERAREGNAVSMRLLRMDGATLGCDALNHQANRFLGSMDEVAIFNRCLTPDDVSKLARLAQP